MSAPDAFGEAHLRRHIVAPESAIPADDPAQKVGGIGRQPLRLAPRGRAASEDFAYDDAVLLEESQSGAVHGEKPAQRARDDLENRVEILGARRRGCDFHEGQEDFPVGGLAGLARRCVQGPLRRLQLCAAWFRPPVRYPSGSITAVSNPDARTAEITFCASEGRDDRSNPSRSSSTRAPPPCRRTRTCR